MIADIGFSRPSLDAAKGVDAASSMRRLNRHRRRLIDAAYEPSLDLRSDSMERSSNLYQRIGRKPGATYLWRHLPIARDRRPTRQPVDRL